MATYETNNLVKLGGLQALAQRTKSELDALDNKIAVSFRSLSVSGNTVSFFNSTDASGTALASFDFPEEIFLDQLQTQFVPNFTFSAATYPGATDPNLDGKPVFVLAVKGDATTNPTLTYSFVNVEALVDVYTAGDTSININGYNVNVRISADTGNLLELKNDGLFVGSDDTKVDKVEGKQLSTEDYTTAEKTKLAGIENGAQVNIIETVKVDGVALTPDANKAVDVNLSGKTDKVANATNGDFAGLDANGNLTDSGVTIAPDADVTAMITDVFGEAD
ncbi:MAG: hypothetical protein IJ685_04580 [Selenomonadaceae bacterium]|nr:hypothetical protein [Selenomonadaceae bacterium]